MADKISSGLRVFSAWGIWAVCDGAHDDVEYAISQILNSYKNKMGHDLR